MPQAPTEAELVLIDEIVARYRSDDLVKKFTKVLPTVVEDARLQTLIHSIKIRTKDPEHLRGKLLRKLSAAKEKGGGFDITPENLFEKVNDLAGMRLLHLHTDQFPAINKLLLEQFAEQKFNVLEGPEARIWDDEYDAFFQAHGVKTLRSTRLYTSVHYVIESNTRTKITAEIQVRTLAEELWGEVDHSFNYPDPCGILACGEQIKVLARLTAGCTRLVDSIFRTRADYMKDGGKC